jgi:amino acid transporter
MSCATVAASWSKYLNAFLKETGLLVTGRPWEVPAWLCHDPFSEAGAWFNLPAVAILLTVTAVLVIGIRESAASNTAMVVVKVGVVIFVIVVGVGYVNSANWTGIPAAERKTIEQQLIPARADALARAENALFDAAQGWSKQRFAAAAEQVTVRRAGGMAETLPVPEGGFNLHREADRLGRQGLALYILDRTPKVNEQLLAEGRITPTEAEARLEAVRGEHGPHLPASAEDKDRAASVVARAREEAPQRAAQNWGLLGKLGINEKLIPIDEATRTSFTPYGLSGLMLGASIVFFAFIGFDSISTHAEEAVRPQRDVPIGIIASLVICTVLYMGVAAVITGMVPYPRIDPEAAVATAFADRARMEGGGTALQYAAVLIALGGLAGMTSVLLITFLSQARVFLAMARDGLLPKGVFGTVHPKFKTPHVSTMFVGGIISVIAAFTPILVLEEMVNIGTLFAFVVVCAAVLILRIKRPDAHRPFRVPVLYVVAPLGILVNLTMMLFLSVDSWLRLVIWLSIGLVIYFTYGYWRSTLGRRAAAWEGS